MSILRPITNIHSWSPTRVALSTVSGKGQLILEDQPYILISWRPKNITLTSNIRARGTHIVEDLPYILIPWNNRVIANVLGSNQGQFSCDALFTCSFEGEAESNRFQSDLAFNVEFVGEPHIHFQVDSQVSVQFGSKGRVIGGFASSCTVLAVFESSAIVYPRFRSDAKINVEFFIRGGQPPDCYYDNAGIPTDAIRNYVF